LDANIRKDGVSRDAGRLRLYASRETHTWIQKAADLFGLGTDAIRWIATDAEQQLDVDELRRQVEADRRLGNRPFLVVGTAGSVSTGAIDPLPEIAALCRDYQLWFHVDGAYGALAAHVQGVPARLHALGEADSIAVDPHKWLYAPIEAGCVLVRDPHALRHAFSYHPDYYQFDNESVNYFEHGPQNSRGFRALKVWLMLQQAGRSGYLTMIGDDIRLARHLQHVLADDPEFQPVTQSLSITTFRYVPTDLRSELGAAAVERYLDELNQALLASVVKSGEAFLSNAVVNGRFLLRACIVNFNTSLDDVEALPRLLAKRGREVDINLRNARFVSQQLS
jgi:glutamate/tyrosine decarboxylase-like PLP-dependent enzyme